MERRGHWWNGGWGRSARRDVYVYEDGGRWFVESRSGGAEGRSAWFEYGDADAADDCVRGLLAEGDGWRRLPVGG